MPPLLRATLRRRHPLFGQRCGLGQVGSRLHDVHDLVAAHLEFVQEGRETVSGRRLDVVQQKDALAAGLQTAEGATHDLGATDVPPIVCQEVDAPGLVALRREIALDRFLAQQGPECGRNWTRRLARPAPS